MIVCSSQPLKFKSTLTCQQLLLTRPEFTIFFNTLQPKIIQNALQPLKGMPTHEILYQENQGKARPLLALYSTTIALVYASIFSPNTTLQYGLFVRMKDINDTRRKCPSLGQWHSRQGGTTKHMKQADIVSTNLAVESNLVFQYKLVHMLVFVH